MFDEKDSGIKHLKVDFQMGLTIVVYVQRGTQDQMNADGVSLKFEEF